MMEVSSQKSTEGEQIGRFMAQVDKLAHEEGIEVAVFAKKNPAGSMYSNVVDPEEAGSIIAASILHALKEDDVPENAVRFIDVIIAAAGHTVEAIKELKKEIIHKTFNK